MIKGYIKYEVDHLEII